MGGTEIAGYRSKSYETLQVMARKTAMFQREINGMGVVQGELSIMRTVLAYETLADMDEARLREIIITTLQQIAKEHS